MRNGKRTSEENVAQLILEGYNGMPSYRYMFRPAEWSDLLAYLKTLRGRPEINSVLQTARGTDEQVLAAGSKVFEERCRSCHDGPDAKAPAVLSIYSRDQLAAGEPARESGILKRVRDNHGGTVPAGNPLDDAALFALFALLKAQ